MGQDAAQKILEDYRAKVGRFRSFGAKLDGLILELLRAAGLNVHSVTHRTKEEPSLMRKISGSEGGYAALADVTDVCGVRIITYFADEVDAVAQLIEKEFKIDRKNSIDKRTALDPDQFGYLSVHYIVSLAANRSCLPEYAEFSGCFAEIQIRSILQHAWAEIEHDLGYKSKLAVPRDVVRQFSRLAGLLEVADDGFTTLRQKINEYGIEVNQKIQTESQKLTIDAVSLKALIESDPVIREVDERVDSITKAGFVPFNPATVENAITAVTDLGFKSIGELQSAIAAQAERLVRFAVESWTTLELKLPFPRGMGFNYFVVLAALDQGGTERLTQVYNITNAKVLQRFKEARERVDTPPAQNELEYARSTGDLEA